MELGDDKKKPSSAKKKRINILIADDQTVVREGLVSLIKRTSDMVVVGEGQQWPGGCESMERTSPRRHSTRFAYA
jgi:hypothetical protein